MRIFVWISGICQALWGDSVLAPQVCSKTLSVCERAPLVCWCVQGRGAGGFPGLLSAPLLWQVTDVWEEGECGELLIVQSLLVPRESHKVSEGRKMGCWGG